MNATIDARTALALAMRDARTSSEVNLPLADLVIEALERNNWRLVGPEYNPTWDYMDYIQTVHDKGRA